MTKINNNYKILKLRSGSDVIAKITGGNKKNLIIHKPMEMKVASFISPDGQDRKNILCMKDWLEYTNKSEISIPKDWVAVFLKPDLDVVRLYEMEKERMELGTVEPRRIDLQEKLLKEELEKESITDDDDIDPNSIIVQFAIPPGLFAAIMAGGFLPQAEEYSNELLESLFSEINEDIINMEKNKNIENNIEEDDEDLGFGNRWKDWPSNPKDLM